MGYFRVIDFLNLIQKMESCVEELLKKKHVLES